MPVSDINWRLAPYEFACSHCVGLPFAGLFLTFRDLRPRFGYRQSTP
jgi:hypothetical protein